MLSSQNAGEVVENAQLEKYVSVANAGKNMISRKPELTICRSMA